MWNQSSPLILGSSSPRRQQLLAEAGIQFEVDVPDVDETELNESPEAMVLRLSLLKGSVVSDRHPQEFVVAADTTVVLDGRVIGKPASRDDAIETLLTMQGRKHHVVGGVAIFHRQKNICWHAVYTSLVTIMPISKSIIERYVATREPLDKAGSYAIQGIGGQFVTGIEGSYTNVVGLPIPELVTQLRSFGALS